MSGIFWRFLGLSPDPAGVAGAAEAGPADRIVAVELVVRNAMPGGGWAWGALTLLLLAGVVWLYRRPGDGLPAWKQRLLMALRGAVTVLLMVILLRPGLQITRDVELRRQFLILLDRSQSMALVDPRPEPEDAVRAAIVLGLADPAGGLDQPLSVADEQLLRSRAELARRALTDGPLHLLGRIAPHVDLRVMTFGRDLREETDATGAAGDRGGVARAEAAVASLSPTDDATAIGDALRDAFDRTRGQPLAAVLLVTDGANNAGQSPLEAARRSTASVAATSAGSVPVHVYAVGVSRPRDAAVLDLAAPELIFPDEDVSVSVRARFGGLAGRDVRLSLREGDQVQLTQTLRIAKDGEMTIPLTWRPTSRPAASQSPLVELTATIDPVAGELLTDNNAASTRVRRVERKIRVLYIESEPRWEFKYVQAVLLRDRRVEARFLLLDGVQPNLAGTSAGAGPMLQRFPASRQELHSFDVIILGDVEGGALTREQLGWIESHVSQFGGAVVFLAGRRFMPWTWGGTALERLVPVEFDASGAAPGAAGARGISVGPPDGPPEAAETAPRRLELTPAGRASSMLRLAESESASLALWQQLPAVYWTAPVGRARPGGEVLVIDSTRTDPAGARPVVVVQRYGAGTSLFIGTDNLWRWRRNVGDLHHARLWGQVVLRLATPQLLGGSRRTQLSTDRRTYLAGQTATVFARLYGPTYEPVVRSQLAGTLRRIDPSDGPGAAVAVLLRPVSDQAGLYRGDVRVPGAGRWQLSVEADDGEASIEFDAQASRAEQLDVAMNADLLGRLAASTGGKFLREEDLHRLPELLTGGGESTRSIRVAELWASPAYFLLLLSLLTAEWLLRKGAGLK